MPQDKQKINILNAQNLSEKILQEKNATRMWDKARADPEITTQNACAISPGGEKGLRGWNHLPLPFLSLLFSCWVMGNSLPPHWLRSTRLLCPWDIQGRTLERVAFSSSGDLPDPAFKSISVLAGKFFTGEPPVFRSVQFSQSCPHFVTPWTAARQASLSITNSRGLHKHKSIESVMPSNHLIVFFFRFHI